MDLAAERLLAAGARRRADRLHRRRLLPAPDWLERQLAHVRAGAQVVAGLIELEPAERSQLPGGAVRRRRSATPRSASSACARLDPGAEHHHFAGASLGVTAGRLPRRWRHGAGQCAGGRCLRHALAVHGIPIRRAADVEVRTSARAVGRGRGAGCRSTSRSRRGPSGGATTRPTFPWTAWRRSKATTAVAVVIPTKECAETIDGVLAQTVGPAARAGLIDEVVVIDAASSGRHRRGCGKRSARA